MVLLTRQLWILVLTGSLGGACADSSAPVGDGVTSPGSTWREVQSARLARFADVIRKVPPARAAELVVGSDSIRVEPRQGRASLFAGLPVHANASWELARPDHDVRIRARLLYARDVPASVEGRFALYESGGPNGTDILMSAARDSVEDYVRIETANVRQLEYEVDVSGVAGLRRVANTLEFLDERGSPRLRIAPPYVMDAANEVRGASLTVSGCDYDTDVRLPWGRAVTPPGSGACLVTVAWDDEGLTYPVAVDPRWSTTEQLAEGRTRHTATLIARDDANGEPEMICVAGGIGTGMLPLSSIECYNPADASWASADDFSGSVQRYDHTATLLLDNSLLLIGGKGTDGPLSSTEWFVPSSGVRAPGPSLPTIPRTLHSATRLGDGSVVVIGGGSLFPLLLEYDPLSGFGSWVDAGKPMGTSRFGHAALLANGRVFVFGGSSTPDLKNPLASVESYDPSAGAEGWREETAMNWARVGHTATLLPSSQSTQNPLSELVLVVGGNLEPELFDPRGREWLLTPQAPRWRRSNHAAVALTSDEGDSFVMVIGGQDGSAVYANSEIYSRSTGTWAEPDLKLNQLRKGHTATVLEDERTVVVVGGEQLAYSVYGDTEYVSLAGPGEACDSSDRCVSGLCSVREHVCCDDRCAGGCESCTVEGGAQRDGKCTTLEQTTPCGEPASECEQPTQCDGQSPACPDKLPLDDGTPCDVGVCWQGVCGPPRGDGGASGAGGQGGSAGSAGSAGRGGACSGATCTRAGAPPHRAGTAGESGSCASGACDRGGGPSGWAGAAIEGGSCAEGTCRSSGGTAGSAGTAGSPSPCATGLCGGVGGEGGRPATGGSSTGGSSEWTGKRRPALRWKCGVGPSAPGRSAPGVLLLFAALLVVRKVRRRDPNSHPGASLPTRRVAVALGLLTSMALVDGCGDFGFSDSNFSPDHPGGFSNETGGRIYPETGGIRPTGGANVTSGGEPVAGQGGFGLTQGTGGASVGDGGAGDHGGAGDAGGHAGGGGANAAHAGSGTAGAGGSDSCSAEATLVARWTRIDAPPGPGARALHAATATADGLLVFGGIRQRAALADEWLLSGDPEQWQALDEGPGARAGHALASSDGSVLLFGGVGATGLLADTWQRTDSWIDLCPAATGCGGEPSARSGHRMAQDPDRGVVVLFGGNDGEPLGDTWEWSEGEGWGSRCIPVVGGNGGAAGAGGAGSGSCGVPARFDHGLDYDAAAHRMVLFGGSDGREDLGDVWVLDDRGWSRLETSGVGPGPRSAHAMAFDPTASRLLVVGGTANGASVPGEVFGLDTARAMWTRARSTGPIPVGRANATLTYAPSEQRLYLYGGGSDPELGDLWSLTVTVVAREDICACVDACIQMCGEDRSVLCQNRCESGNLEPVDPRLDCPASGSGGGAGETTGAAGAAGTAGAAGSTSEITAPTSAECVELWDCCGQLDSGNRRTCEQTASFDDSPVCSALVPTCQELQTGGTDRGDSCLRLGSCCVALDGSLRSTCVELLGGSDSGCEELLFGGFCVGY